MEEEEEVEVEYKGHLGLLGAIYEVTIVSSSFCNADPSLGEVLTDPLDGDL